MTDSETAPAQMAQGPVEQQLDRIAAEFVADFEARSGSLPWVEFDPQWPSKCIQSRQTQAIDHALIDTQRHDERGLALGQQEVAFWKPTVRTGSVDLSGLETALELQFPAEYKRLFSHFWSASIPVVWDNREFELLQLWNMEDEENLRHNLLGHVFETRRVRQSATLFFGLVDDQRFLSVEISSGKIYLEELGGKRPQEVAESLVTLLNELSGRAHPTSDGLAPQ